MKLLNAYKDGKGNIVITEGSFEYLLNCLDNQKYISSAPQNQSIIDEFNDQCRNIWSQKYIFDTDYDGYYLYKKYLYQDDITIWNDKDMCLIHDIFKDKKRKEIIVDMYDKNKIIEEFVPWLFERPMQCDGKYLTISEDGRMNRKWKPEEIEKISEHFNAYLYSENEKNYAERWTNQLSKMDLEFIQNYMISKKIKKLKDNM